ncbi:MAG TPA: HAMP domain-containing protein, partial [Chthonomonadaceae bacterium]|nr:HAMP domain-containing protein [Chthonomonadaceae bacterium]
MSIKARLAINTLLVTLSIGAIAFIGLHSLFTIQASIDQLTRNSTPLQVKTLQLQEGVERLSAEFLRLGVAQTPEEARQAAETIRQDIEAIRKLDDEVAQLNGKASGLDISQFQDLLQTVSQAVQEKLSAVQSYKREADSVSKALQGTETSLSGIHSQVTAMTTDSFNVVRSSQQSNLQMNTAVKKVLNLQFKFKEIETLLAEIDATRSKYRLTPFKEKIKAATDAVQNIPADKSDPPVFQNARTTAATVYEQVTKDTTGLLALRATALAAKEAEGDYNTAKAAIATSLSKVSASLGEVVDPLELQLLKSRQAEERALDLQSRTGQVVSSAALIEMGTKELNSQVRLVMLSVSPTELDAKAAALKTIQKRITADLQELRASLNATGQTQTTQHVDAIAGALQKANASADQIVTAKRYVLTSDALMQTTIERVTTLAHAQSQNGDIRLQGATEHQKETVAAVNARVRQSFSLMVALSVVAIAIAIGFSGLLMLRITRPLNALSKTVLAVASRGDFSLRVPLHSRDEVGKTVQAFNSLMDTLQAAISRINAVMEGVAEGDFQQRVEGELSGDLNTLQESINTTVAGLQEAVKHINTVMEGVSAGDFSHRIDAPLSGDLEALKRSVNTSVDKLRDAIQGINRVME